MPDKHLARVKKEALVPFDSLEIGDWFVFPKAIERLVNSDQIDDMSRALRFYVKVGDSLCILAEDVHERLRAEFCEPKELIIKLIKPPFLSIG